MSPSLVTRGSRGVGRGQVAIVLFRNTGTEAIRPLGSSVRSSVKYVDDWKKVVRTPNSELPRPIPRNYLESDHGCTSRIYFDKRVIT